MFTPNEQNLAGLENVCRDIRREETEGREKKIRLHFVAANVPDLDDENRILRRQLRAFRERLGFAKLSGVIWRYENLSLLDQSVVVLDRRRSKLAREYQRLVDILIMDNYKDDRDAAMSFLDNYIRARPWGTGHVPLTAQEVPLLHSLKTRKLAEISDNPLKQIAESFLDDPDVFLRLAQCWTLDGDIRSAKKALDNVLRLQPSLAEVLFKPALCKARLQDKDGAVADLFACLQLPDREPQEVLRFYQELQTIAPDRLSEAVALPAFREYPTDLQTEIASILGETEEGLSRAIDILRNQSQGDLFRHLLFRARRWNEFIGEMQALDEYEQQSPPNALDLAFAYWGVTGILAEDRCRFVLECWDKYADISITGPEDQAWALWGTRKTKEALVCLDEAEKWALEQGDADTFSRWRYRRVPVYQYLQDLRSVRRLFQGEPLRPEFLGPASS